MAQIVQMMRTLRSMPPLPAVAHRVLQIVRDPEYSVDTLVGVVRVDPSLTARLLDLCNSSLFGLSQQVATVAHAVAYLGSRNLVKLVVVTCTSGYFRNVRKTTWCDANELWRHTLACANACQFLAERCGYAEAATAFTSGILHNVGKIALAQFGPDGTDGDANGDAGVANDDTWVDRERRLLGLDHAAAAGVVADSWKLPEDLRRAIKGHHDPAQLAAGDRLTALLHVADETVLAMGIGKTFPDTEHVPSAAALAALGLATRDVAAVAAEVEAELKRSAELLNLDKVARR